MLEKKPYIKAETKITCPKCYAEIGKFNNDVFKNDVMKQSDVSFNYKFIKPGAVCICPGCKAPWMKVNKIHLEYGWM